LLDNRGFLVRRAPARGDLKPSKEVIMRSIVLHRASPAWLVPALALVVGLLAFAAPSKAAFPGANGKIAFGTDRDGNKEIYTMYPDGSGLTRLTNNVSDDRSPAWSPDGTKIAFTSDRDGGEQV
jgi:dipeptidyl aminopeptidase/acylaminoacyl peptidase